MENEFNDENNACWMRWNAVDEREVEGSIEGQLPVE